MSENTALSSVFLENLSANNQVTPFANEIVQITSLPTFGSGGIFLSYSFPSGQDLFDYFDLDWVNDEQSELFNNFISNVISNEEGDLWVLTMQSLEHYVQADETWYSYQLPANRIGEPVAISVQRDGSIICVNDSYVLVFMNGEFADFDFDVIGGNGDLRGGIVSTAGSVWVNIQNGVLTLNQEGDQIFYEQVKATSGKDSKVISLAAVSSIKEDGAGEIWMATPTELLSFSGDHWTYYSIGFHPQLMGEIRAMEIDQEGHLWVLSGNNLIQIKLDGSWNARQLNISQADLDGVYAIYIDADFQVWLQTNSGQLHFQFEY
ncbi:MAG: hypothetical protein KDC34_01265 [Saprospiraceae bacterium]|nr:hypothetical protein [Saprospiraceae bacterium]